MDEVFLGMKSINIWSRIMQNIDTFSTSSASPIDPKNEIRKISVLRP